MALAGGPTSNTIAGQSSGIAAVINHALTKGAGPTRTIASAATPPKITSPPPGTTVDLSKDHIVGPGPIPGSHITANGVLVDGNGMVLRVPGINNVKPKIGTPAQVAASQAYDPTRYVLPSVQNGGKPLLNGAPLFGGTLDLPIGAGTQIQPQAPGAAAGTPYGLTQAQWAQILGNASQPPPSAGPPPQMVNPGQVQVPGVPASNSKLESQLLAGAIGNSNPDYGKMVSAATPYAQAITDPLIAALAQQGLQNANTVSGYTRGAQGALGNLGAQVGQYYGQAEGLQNQLSNGISQGLNSLNPDVNDIRTAAAAGATPGQLDAIHNQDTTSFPLAGQVLGGLGQLQVGNLAAQAAAAKSYAAQLPALLGVAGSQALSAEQIGNQTALAKLLSQQSADTTKIAGQLSSTSQKAAGIDSGLYKGLTENDYKGQQQSIDVQKANVANTIKVNQDNATNYLRSVSNATSAYQAQTARGRYIVSIYKAMNPTASATTSSTASKDARTYFQTAAGMKATGTTPKQIGVNPSTRTPIYRNVPSYKTQDYSDAINQYATARGGTPQDFAFATSVANSFYNYGYGDRPLDPGMAKVLQGAGAVPTFHVNTSSTVPGVPKGTPFFTHDQVYALNQSGYADFAHSLTVKMVPGIGQIYIIPKLK